MRSNRQLIIDTPLSDYIAGSDEHEQIEIGYGNDRVNAGGGNDVIWDMDGTSVSLGSRSSLIPASDDRIDGGGGSDLIYGGLGADKINGGDAFDTLDYRYSLSAVTLDLRTGVGGGTASSASNGDVVTSIEEVLGSRFADTLQGSNGLCVIKGEDGNDTLAGGRGETRMYGGAGHDTFVVNGLQNTVSGGDGIDTVDFSNLAYGVNVGGHRATDWDRFFGFDGDQNIPAGARDFALPSDIESVVGSRHDDFIRINPTGWLTGAFLDGGGGNDVLTGNDGDDRLLGGEGNDILQGGLGKDVLKGGEGNDKLFGGSQEDVLDGGSGDDVLDGGYYEDVLTGGSGNDRLNGGSENDTLTGGSGSDSFVFEVFAGRDTITDFENGIDRIDLSGLAGRGHDPLMLRFIDGNGPAVIGYASAWSSIQGNDTVVEVDRDGDFAADVTITLNGQHALTRHDFVLGTFGITMQATSDFFF